MNILYLTALSNIDEIWVLLVLIPVLFLMAMYLITLSISYLFIIILNGFCLKDESI